MLPIVVPYTELYAETRAAVPDACFVELTEDDSYRMLLRDLWLIGDPVIVVEHDVAPTAEQIQCLRSCDRAWCHYGYVAGDWVPKLGCVKLGRELIAGTQGVWDDPAWPWGQLDARFAGAARAAGFDPHWHYPHVLHLRNVYVGVDGNEHRVRYDRQTEMVFLQAEIESLRGELHAAASASG